MIQFLSSVRDPELPFEGFEVRIEEIKILFCVWKQHESLGLDAALHLISVHLIFRIKGHSVIQYFSM